jgi:hypothetical protein
VPLQPCSGAACNVILHATPPQEGSIRSFMSMSQWQHVSCVASPAIGLRFPVSFVHAFGTSSAMRELHPDSWKRGAAAC